MLRRLNLLFLFSLLNAVSFAQTGETASNDSTSASDSPQTSGAAKTEQNEFIFKPAIGLGTGMFNFFGDLYDKHFQAPMVSRIGYELNVAQNFTDYLQFNFYALFGKLGANERLAPNNRNLNFESQIRVGGINLTYNFGNFLPKDRDASPFISLGFESFEFLSKTDMYDAYGNRYYYWSDGSTRNIDEHASNASSAVVIHRDYTYESDIREMNLDGFGKYAERSWAVPVGAGAIFKINDYFSFKLATTMHFTFTDYIDGVSDKSTGNRAGTKGKDKFMMTSCSIHYNFGQRDKQEDEIDDQDTFNDVDFFALDLSDLDKDGVPDAKDSCQGTPPGVPVDAKGCPLDDDNDLVPNYKDDELNSPKDAFVDIKGVQLTDSILDYQYRFYMDSTGAFAEVIRHDHNGKELYNTLYQKEYSVELGTFHSGLPPELMTKFLSIGDIASTNIDDSTTIYTAGKFNTLLDAEIRKKQLVAEGLKDAKVVYKQNGKFYNAPAYSSGNTGDKGNAGNTGDKGNAGNTGDKGNAGNTGDKGNAGNTGDKGNAGNTGDKGNTGSSGNNLVNNTKGVVLRVQLGAYKNRLSKSVFRDVPDLIEIKTEDGLYKYMSGSFTTFDEAAKHKVNLLLKGYQGAFITAYKDGKRVSLLEAGATPMKKEDLKENTDSAAVSTVDKKLVTFKVQVGVFKSEPPADKLAKFEKIKNISKETTPTGLNRYTIGPFKDYASAQAAKNDMIKNIGIDDAFVLAFFNGEYITIQEALELLK
ncbi:MAG: SPOR domain-containing protein [Bacteroidia bacterium]